MTEPSLSMANLWEKFYALNGTRPIPGERRRVFYPWLKPFVRSYFLGWLAMILSLILS